MSGFIYIWRDSKHNKFYIGSHWGIPSDGYICSSSKMRDNHRNRPQDFKRRILSTITTNREDLLQEEQRWIDMIKPEEFGRKYYNINAKVATYLWWMNDVSKKQVVDKIKEGVKHGKHHRPRTEEQKRRISEQKKTYYASLTPAERKAKKKPWTEEQKIKNKFAYQYERTDAQKKATEINQQLGAAASPITKKGYVSGRWKINKSIDQPQIGKTKLNDKIPKFCN
jgi:hypothetical protein